MRAACGWAIAIAAASQKRPRGARVERRIEEILHCCAVACDKIGPPKLRTAVTWVKIIVRRQPHSASEERWPA